MSSERRVISPGQAARVGNPVRTGWGTPTERLDDLADVDLSDAPSQTPVVWRRGADGVWRTEPMPERWGNHVTFSADRPDPETAPPDSIWVELTGDVKLWMRGT